MADFITDRNLLNPRFEGYKLSPLPQEEHVLRYPLASKPTQANVSGRTKVPLSFQEVQSRITHNHLAVSLDRRYALYIDEHFNVIRIDLSPDGPVFRTLVELPKPVHSPEQAASTHIEYPSAVSYEPDSWLISDGYGTVYALRISGDVIEIPVRCCLPSQNGFTQNTPFKLHAAKIVSPDRVFCALSCREPGQHSSHEKPTFNLVLAAISLGMQSDDLAPMEISWLGHGEDIPMHIYYDSTKNAFCVLSNTVFRRLDVPPPPQYEPSEDEIVPVPRADETPVVLPNKPPPYSWTQTDDSVTVAFPLPSVIPKSAIHVTITSQALSLWVNFEGRSLVDLPKFTMKQFWDNVRPTTSFWTWDKEGGHDVGLLTLHLDKQHEGTRWTHVFASVGKVPADEVTEPTDVEVPETVDPSELVKIRETLEKYTSALKDGEDMSGLGLGRGVPSLAEGELDEEVDANVGRKFWVTWVKADGGDPTWDVLEGLPSYLLSVPVPGLDETSLIIRNDIDGLLFSPPVEERSTAWKHTFTYPALAFVLASKRDIRFTHHVGGKVALAFESGTGVGGGNMFIYKGVAAKRNWAEQHIFKISGGAAGALLGVGVLPFADGHAIACLCEQELVLVKGVL